MAIKTIEGIAISIIFAFLWIPVGQIPFLIEHWMKLGTFVLPMLFFIAITFQEPGNEEWFRAPKLLGLFLFGAYLIHQFEEHWIDVFGNEYAFQGSINSLVQRVLSSSPDKNGPLTAEAIFVINTSLVWLVAAIAIWQAPQRVFPTLALASIVIINAFVHIAGGVLTLSYNPGLLTSIIVFVPLATLTYLRIPARQAALLLSIVWAVLAHIIMAVGMMASTWWGLISPRIYYAILITWSVLPFAVSVVAPRKFLYEE
ncbi:MAG: HXXEE domain-containing protein [Pseudomonadota bacterium]